MTEISKKLAKTNQRMAMQICTIPSPVVTQALAAAGSDAVIIDLEHGAVDFASAHAMIAATAGTDYAPLVRIPELSATHVKRVLDLGAEGIVFPLIRTAEDAKAAVQSLHYPPEGTRGFGPFIAHLRYGQDMMSYAQNFPDHAVCCLLAETREAGESIEEICAVPGIDMIVPAQFDLSVALGIPGQFDHPDFVAAVTRIETAAKEAGLPLGGVGLTEAQAKAQFAKGYRIVVGFDVLWLKGMAGQMRDWCADTSAR